MSSPTAAGPLVFTIAGGIILAVLFFAFLPVLGEIAKGLAAVFGIFLLIAIVIVISLVTGASPAWFLGAGFIGWCIVAHRRGTTVQDQINKSRAADELAAAYAQDAEHGIH